MARQICLSVCQPPAISEDGNLLDDPPAGKRDFFISFNQADRAWATWIAWVLEEAKYSVWFQDWDFRGNFVEHMNRAHRKAERTVAVLSDHYFGSDFTLAEWSARFAQDPAGTSPAHTDLSKQGSKGLSESK